MERDLQVVRAIKAQLSESGVAAVISPDGTGKGCAALALVKDTAGETVFWLTADRKRQNLRRRELQRLDGGLPDNLQFLNCEQLEQSDAAQWVLLAQQRPGLVVLDGWRRLRAMQWKWCVERLRRICPQAKLLGLASPDRPADCWAAETLFREHVVLHQTLGQALAQNRLPMPSVFLPLLWPLEQAKKNFQDQSRNLRKTGRSEESEKYSTAFSRAVEKTAPAGKLLQEALPKGAILALCENEAARAALDAEETRLFDPPVPVLEWKKDADHTAVEELVQKADTMVLLVADRDTVMEPLCGLTGAILLRSTSEEGSFRRMLNTALTVCGGVPVADLEASAECLAPVRALRQEVEKENGPYFPVQEPMQAVFRTARQLQRSLDAEWDRCYAAAKAAAVHRDLNEVPRGEIVDGFGLGRWLEIQRQVRAGERPGRLPEEQIARLDKLGLVWKQRLEVAWERGYQSAKQYRSTHADLLVPVRYHDKKGFALGEWIVYNRQRYLSGNLSPERVERLQALGMVWDTAMSVWNQNYAAAVQYFLEHRSLEVPVKYSTPDGLALGVWLGSQRAAYKENALTPEQIAELEALGIDWTNRNDRKWQLAYEAAVQYYNTHGDLNVPSEYVDPDGVLLGKWISRQRYAWQNPDRSSARVTPERKALLDAIGMLWEKSDSWQHRYELAAAYKKEHGNLAIPTQYRTEDGVWLGSWLNRQKQLLRKKESSLSPERRKALRELFRGETAKRAGPHPQCTVREQNWLNNYRRAKAYVKRMGDLLVPASYVDETGFRLGVWISNLRAARKTRPDSFQVTPEHIGMLDAIGMQWDAREAKWQCAFHRAGQYRELHGDLNVPVNYKTPDGFCLGDWVRRMRESYAAQDARLTPDRIAQLNALGMVWETSGS